MKQANALVPAGDPPPHTAPLVVVPQSGLPTVSDLEQQFALAVRQRELLSDYIKKQLKPGKHFYEIQGSKPSLTKEGAEIILLPHNLAPDYELISGPSEPPENAKPYQITVKCTLRRKGDPASFVGSGIGSAGSEKRNRDGKYLPRQQDKYLCHNATLKMAEKSAMIAATMNSTAASEFFTQDLDEAEAAPQGNKSAPRNVQPAKPPPAAVPPPTFPSDKTLKFFIEQAGKKLAAAKVENPRGAINAYFRKIGKLLPTEEIEALSLQYCPMTGEQIRMTVGVILELWVNGKEVALPFTPHDPKAPGKAVTQPAASPVTSPPSHPEAFWDAVFIIPRKGTKRDEYMKNPDTIGSLYDAAHGNGDQDAAKRLFGTAHHWKPEARTYKGKTYQPTEEDHAFRKHLDDFLDWHEKHKDDSRQGEMEFPDHNPGTDNMDADDVAF
jgi:hypothetical protein